MPDGGQLNGGFVVVEAIVDVTVEAVGAVGISGVVVAIVVVVVGGTVGTVPTCALISVIITQMHRKRRPFFILNSQFFTLN